MPITLKKADDTVDQVLSFIGKNGRVSQYIGTLSTLTADQQMTAEVSHDIISKKVSRTTIRFKKPHLRTDHITDSLAVGDDPGFSSVVFQFSHPRTLALTPLTLTWYYNCATALLDNTNNGISIVNALNTGVPANS